MMTYNHCMRGYMVHGHIHGNTDADYFPYLATHAPQGKLPSGVNARSRPVDFWQ